MRATRRETVFLSMTVEWPSSEQPCVTIDTIIGWFCDQYAKHRLVHSSSRSSGKSTPMSKVEAKWTATVALKRTCSPGGVNRAAGAFVESRALPDGSTNQSVCAPSVILRLLSGPTFQSTGSFFHGRSPGREGRSAWSVLFFLCKALFGKIRTWRSITHRTDGQRLLSTNRPDDRSGQRIVADHKNVWQSSRCAIRGICRII